jgi:hypothetical protein
MNRHLKEGEQAYKDTQTDIKRHMNKQLIQTKKLIKIDK